MICFLNLFLLSVHVTPNFVTPFDNVLFLPLYFLIVSIKDWWFCTGQNILTHEKKWILEL